MCAMVALHAGALMRCWIGLCAALLQLTSALDFTETEHTDPFTKSPPSSGFSHATPCFVDDIVTLLGEGLGEDGELNNDSLALFGICAAPHPSPASVLLDLTNQKNTLGVLDPAAVSVSEEGERGVLVLIFRFQQSSMLRESPVLLLAFEHPLMEGHLDVTFTSQSLQPRVQSVCFSDATQYILLTGKSSGGIVDHKWRISVETKAPNTNQNLKGILTGEKSGSNTSMTPLLLSSAETRTDTRCHSGSSPTSLQTSFLCELKRFLGAVIPQKHPQSPQIRLDSLQSLPPLTLGLSSSETLLAALINSSTPTIFSFSNWGSVAPLCPGVLAMSPALLEELRRRLEELVTQLVEIIRQEQVMYRAAKSLRRLKELSEFQKKELVTGESQFRSFLLLKALQTVSHTYALQRSLRASRADPIEQVRGHVCGLRSLTVSLKNHFLAPDFANINNCHGSCAFPLTNSNNHAIMLNYHMEGGGVDVRAPCCVPLAYKELQVMDVDNGEATLSSWPAAVATECGCR